MKKKFSLLVATILSLIMTVCTFASCGLLDMLGAGGVAKPASLTLSSNSIELFVNETSRLTATVLDQDGNKMEEVEVVWASADEKVATVTDTGRVKGVGEGSTNVSASVGELTATCKITIKVKRTITISEETAEIDLDSEVTTLQLTATCSDGGAVTWQSSDETVATVDQNGLVTAINADEKSRQVTITATRGEATAACVVTVIKPSAPETYEITRGTSNATVATMPGTWFYFEKTSDGAEFSVTEHSYSSNADDTVIKFGLAYATPTNGEGKDSQCYLRYQPDYEPNTQYIFSCTLTSNTVGYVVINDQRFDVTEAGQTIEIAVNATSSESMPLNIRLYFFGGSAAEPLETPISIQMNKIAFTLGHLETEEPTESI